MVKAVLSMIVKDSVERVGEDVFLKVLEASLQVPYYSVILVDDSSSEKTAEAVRRFAEENGKELVATRSRLPQGWSHPTRATARQTALDTFFENFSEEWLMFLDDDCVLNQGWWKWVEENKALEDERVGEVWGINWDADISKKRYIEALGRDYGDYLVEAFERRGGTHDTLLRRKAVEGVRIPPELHVLEDAWLHHYVRCRGYRYVVNPVGVTHLHPPEPLTFSREKQQIKQALKVALKYGIVAESYSVPRSRLGAWLSLVRPVVGLAPTVWVHLRVYGAQGVPIAVKKQLVKLMWRYYVARSLRGDLPDVCEAIKNYHAEL
ncbi:MAG: glycosyltransferase family A protein [Thermofilum sp.]